MTFILAALGVLGVSSSGPLIAATLGATSVTALAFWRNAISAAGMAGPVLLREPRQFGLVTAGEFRWSLVAGVALAFRQPLAGFESAGWLGFLTITVAARLVGHTAFSHLPATPDPLLVSMIILLEIPGAALLAAAFLSETLPGGTYAGLGMILAGLAVVVLGQRGPGPARGKEPALAEPGTG